MHIQIWRPRNNFLHAGFLSPPVSDRANSRRIHILIAQALGATNAGTMAKRRLRSPRGSQNDANAVEVKVEEYGGVV